MRLTHFLQSIAECMIQSLHQHVRRRLQPPIRTRSSRRLPGNLFIDARAGIADIPGDGTTKITFTSVQDTAKFVAASLDLDKWEELSGIVGETKTFDEVVDVAERITGKTFLRTYLIKGGGERAERLLESLIYSEVSFGSG